MYGNNIAAIDMQPYLGKRASVTVFYILGTGWGAWGVWQYLHACRCLQYKHVSLECIYSTSEPVVSRYRRAWILMLWRFVLSHAYTSGLSLSHYVTNMVNKATLKSIMN